MKLSSTIGALFSLGGVLAGVVGCQDGLAIPVWPAATARPSAQSRTPTATPFPPTITLVLPAIREPVTAPETTPTPAGTVTAGSSVVTATTPARRLTPVPSPQVPVMGGKLVFETAGGGDIYVVNADGTGLRRLTHGLDPAWSPHRLRIARLAQIVGWWEPVRRTEDTGKGARCIDNN